MKKEYDFSNAERGRFYRPEAKLQVPIYLDPEILAYLQQHADRKGIEVGEPVNDLLRRGIDALESVK